MPALPQWNLKCDSDGPLCIPLHRSLWQAGLLRVLKERLKMLREKKEINSLFFDFKGYETLLRFSPSAQSAQFAFWQKPKRCNLKK